MTEKLNRETAVELNIPLSDGARSTIIEFMEYYNITVEEFAKRGRFNVGRFQNFLDNNMRLTVMDAVYIEALTGISAQLLIDMELAYAKQGYDEIPEDLKLERYDFVKGESDESNQ